MWRLRNCISYVIFNIVMILISHLFDKQLGMIQFIVCYNLIQQCFNKRFHSDTIIKDSAIKADLYCKAITIVVEIIYLIISIKATITLYLNILIILSFCFASYLLQFCLERIATKKSNLNYVNKKLLIEMCKEASLTPLVINRMVLKYVEHKTYKEIATIEYVDESTIKKSINRARKKLNI